MLTMIYVIFLSALHCLFFSISVHAQDLTLLETLNFGENFKFNSTFYATNQAVQNNNPHPEKDQTLPGSFSRKPKWRYAYKDRSHSKRETFEHILTMYGITWIVYPLTQPKVVFEDGSVKKYKKNFGQLVFDKDEPFWNWIVHPLSGSQLFLYYRANGYSRIDSLALAFVSSTLFEFTVEIYTEPASVQDLYQTPILGSVLGVGLENLSLYLLNTGNMFGKIMGSIMNPWSMFSFFETKVMVSPLTNYQDTHGLLISARF